MTEDTAKTKWCPMARYSVGADDNNAANRWKDGKETGDNPKECHCIASECMMWRWKYGDKPVGRFIALGAEPARLVEPDERPSAIPDDWTWVGYDADEDTRAGWREPIEQADKRRKGYCGLAGVPT